jgi:transketolase
MNNSVVVVSVGAGYAYGSQGYTHHALEDIAVLRALPNMDVIVPADPHETIGITKLLASTKNPSYLRLGKSNEPLIHAQEISITPGKVNEISAGADGTIIFSGSVGVVALEAANELASQSITVSVASMPFVSRIDLDYLKRAVKKGPVVIVEEHSYRGGVGSAVLETLSMQSISGRVALVASAQTNLSQIGDQDFLRDANGINADSIVSKFKALLVS